MFIIIINIIKILNIIYTYFFNLYPIYKKSNKTKYNYTFLIFKIKLKIYLYY